MIYIFISDTVNSSSLLPTLQQWKSMRQQVQFVLGPNADTILRTYEGLEQFNYLFSLEKELFQQLVDLRFEIEPESLLISDLSLSLSRIFRFQEALLENPLKTDFYRLLDIDRLQGAFFMTKLGYNRLWSISPGHPIKESLFRWVNLDPDKCLNLPQEKTKNLSNIE